MSDMYRKREARRTLNQDYITPYLRQTQWGEAVELKKIITELFERKGSPIDILDIGVGYARVPVNLAEIEEIWKSIGKYDGIDNNGICLREAKNNVKRHNLSDRVDIIRFDARNLNELLHSKQRYDLVLCTYFTAGNFSPYPYPFYKKIDWGIESAFQRVFKPAYDLLRSSGKLVLGSVYKDNESTAKRQREFYEECGMTVISKPTDPFTATKEGFWSLRFTEEKIKDFFDFIKPKNIEIRPLDTYNFAQMIIISKR